MKYFEDEPDPPPFLESLNDTGHLAAREGWCFQHGQAITLAIDQYAEAATGNCGY